MQILEEVRPEAGVCPPDAPARTAAVIRGELAEASRSVGPLRTKLSAAEARLADAQARYDADVYGFALGCLQAEPGREELFAAIASLDGLKRVLSNTFTLEKALAAELEAVHAAELAETERVRILPLLAAAEKHMAEFEAALLVVKQVESRLFDALYDRTAGLLQPFGPDLVVAARKARGSVARRVRAAAEKAGFAENPSFSSDEGVYLGDPIPVFFRRLKA